ncbi:sugar-binding transcriptional regulator [Notoacmeibacter marinus]|uniref:sugar-binding transcriptional regulator n=1 Tax=Notoacmeibacter marinus TaxID=1876515 RepID=UPI000DF380F8|nr:sugar-binding transcriptional regulator [Notoacmeibacter marinus]
MSPARNQPNECTPERRTIRQDDAIVEASWCYFHEGMNQNEIAARLGVSRATVVNYLAEARRRDYVRVTLDTEIFLNHRLAERLRERFGLQQVLVVPSASDEPDRSYDRVARAAADWLPHLLEPGDRLGVAWGETISRVADAAPRQPIDDLTIVQLVGSRPAAMGFAAETCAAALAARFSANLSNLHVPLLLSDRDLTERLKEEPVVATQLDAVASCNKVIFACGTVDDDSHIRRTGLLTTEELARYRGEGATGVICARLIDANGAPIPTEIEERMIGVTLDQMRGKSLGLLVASGRERVPPSRAAILGGYATHFATCSDTAQTLLGD